MMNYRHHRCWIPGAIGFVAGLATLSLAMIAPDAVLRTEVAVSDFLFLADGGPGWGRLPPADRIVLVLYDDASQRQMKALPTFEDDLALYRQLLDADAKLIVDTRMIADGGGDETIPIREFLEAVVQTHAQGRLFRDVWIAEQ
jgi:hypothetical protein